MVFAVPEAFEVPETLEVAEVFEVLELEDIVEVEGLRSGKIVSLTIFVRASSSKINSTGSPSAVSSPWRLRLRVGGGCWSGDGGALSRRGREMLAGFTGQPLRPAAALSACSS